MAIQVSEGLARVVTAHLAGVMVERLRAATPMLSWRAFPLDSPVPIHQGGSAFLIRTPRGILGVTAGHVFDGYIQCKRGSSQRIEAILGGLHFDLAERLICRGAKIDIATFRITEDDLSQIGFEVLDGAWPPRMPANRGIVVLAGWPGHERVVTPTRVSGGAWAGIGNVGVSEHQLTVVIDHSLGLLSPIPGVPPPPPNFDVGGISGGPMMAVEACSGGLDWYLAGVLAEGKPEYDQVAAERADDIQDDGMIRN